MNAAKRVGADAAGRLIALLLAAGLWGFAHQAQADPVRVGELKFGTVAWNLEVIKQHELDPIGNVAKPRANARRYHQKSLVDRDKAEKIVEVPSRLVSRLETISNQSGKDG